FWRPPSPGSPYPASMPAIVKQNRAPGRKVTTVPKPSPGPGEVLIAVRHAGVCGTDLHIADWNAWAEGRLQPPLVVGHEFAGEIVAVGGGVAELRTGQLVTAEGHIVCGHCLQCRTGNSHICKNTRIIGVDRDGAFAEYIAMPATNVLPLDGIPTTVGADVVCEMSGVPSALHQAFAAVRLGGRVQLLGIPNGQVPVDFANEIIFKGITVYGVIGRKMYDTWNQMRRYLSAGLVDPRPVITHQFPLAKIDEALAAIRSGDAGKIILEIA